MADEKKTGQLAKVASDVALEAGSSAAVAAAVTGGNPRVIAIALAAGALKAIWKSAGASLIETFRPAITERDENRVAGMIVAAGEARGQPAEEVVRDLAYGAHDEGTQTCLRETLRSLLDALDPAAVEPLGRLLAEYMGPPRRAPDHLLRGLARLFADSSAEDLQRLREIVGVAAGVMARDIAVYAAALVLDTGRTFIAPIAYGRLSPIGVRPTAEADEDEAIDEAMPVFLRVAEEGHAASRRVFYALTSNRLEALDLASAGDDRPVLDREMVERLARLLQ